MRFVRISDTELINIDQCVSVEFRAAKDPQKEALLTFSMMNSARQAVFEAKGDRAIRLWDTYRNNAEQ